MRKLFEYHIPMVKDFPILIKTLFALCLQEDKSWHFLLEGPVFYLRVSEETCPSLEQFLDDADYEYEYKGIWADNIPITARYQEYFQPMFHSFSMIAVKADEEENVGNLLDRVCHIFMNNIRILEWDAANIDFFWEPNYINKSGAARTKMIFSILRNQIINLEKQQEALQKTIQVLAEPDVSTMPEPEEGSYHEEKRKD